MALPSHIDIVKIRARAKKATVKIAVYALIQKEYRYLRDLAKTLNSILAHESLDVVELVRICNAIEYMIVDSAVDASDLLGLCTDLNNIIFLQLAIDTLGRMNEDEIPVDLRKVTPYLHEMLLSGYSSAGEDKPTILREIAKQIETILPNPEPTVYQWANIISGRVISLLLTYFTLPSQSMKDQ